MLAKNSLVRRVNIFWTLLPPLLVVLFAGGILTTVLAIGENPLATIGFNFFGHLIHVLFLALTLVVWGVKHYEKPTSTFIVRFFLLLVVYAAAGIIGWSLAAWAGLITF